MTSPSEAKLLEAKDKLAEENVWLRTQLDELMAQKFSVKNQSEILVQRLESFEKSAAAEKASLHEKIKELEQKLQGQGQEEASSVAAKTEAGDEAKTQAEATPRDVELMAEIEKLKTELSKQGGSETNVLDVPIEQQKANFQKSLTKSTLKIAEVEEKADLLETRLAQLEKSKTKSHSPPARGFQTKPNLTNELSHIVEEQEWKLILVQAKVDGIDARLGNAVQALEKQNSDLMTALSKEKAMVQSLEDKLNASTDETRGNGTPKSVEEELTDYKEKCKSWEAKYTKQMEQSSEELKKLQMGATQSAEANAETQMLVLSMQKELENLQVECKNHAAEAQQAPLLRSTIAEQETKIMVLQSQLTDGAPESMSVLDSGTHVKASPGGALAMSGVRLRIRAVIEQALTSQATSDSHRLTWLESKLQKQVVFSQKLAEQMHWLEEELVSPAQDEAQKNEMLAKVAARKAVAAAVNATTPAKETPAAESQSYQDELATTKVPQELEKQNVVLQQQLEASRSENTAHHQRIETLTLQLQQVNLSNQSGVGNGMAEDRLQTEQNRSASLEEQMCFLEEQLVASAGSSEAGGQILASVAARKVVQAALGSIATTAIKERDQLRAKAAAPHDVTALEERLQKELSHSKDLEDQMGYLEEHLSASMSEKDKDLLLAQVAARKAVSAAVGTFGIAASTQSATQQLKELEMQGGSGGIQDLEVRLRKELKSRSELEEQMSWLEEQLVASAGQSQADRQSMLAGVAARKVVSVAVGKASAVANPETERIVRGLEEEVKFAKQTAQAGEHRIKWLEERLKTEVDRREEQMGSPEGQPVVPAGASEEEQNLIVASAAAKQAVSTTVGSIAAEVTQECHRMRKELEDAKNQHAVANAKAESSSQQVLQLETLVSNLTQELQAKTGGGSAAIASSAASQKADHVRVQAECEQLKKELENQRSSFDKERNALWEELNARKLKATSSEMPLKTSDIAKSAQTAPVAQSSLSAQPPTQTQIIQPVAPPLSPTPLSPRLLNGSAVRGVSRENSNSQPPTVTRIISAPTPSGYPSMATPTVVAPNTFARTPSVPRSASFAPQRVVTRAPSPLRPSASFSMTPGPPVSPRVIYRAVSPQAGISPIRGVPTQPTGPVVVTPHSFHRAVRAPGVALS